MKIKNESELAHVLGMGFSNYANQLQNAHNLQLYHDLMGDGIPVHVTVSLSNGELTVEEGPDIDAYKAEIKHLESRVKEQKKEIASLNILLEEKTEPPVDYPNTPIIIGEEEMPLTDDKGFYTEPEPEEKSKKPKKKRGKRK